jgi:hypothetical protein
MARPIPAPPPVTSATLSLRVMSMSASRMCLAEEF